MSNIRIESTQNVAIDFELAGAGNRIGAALIDLAIYLAYYLLVLVIASAFDYDQYVIWVMCIPLTFYHLLFEIALNGQSPGKKVLKLKVIRLDGTKPTVGDYTLRWLFRLIDTFLAGIVAIISISSSKNQQRIGDFTAGTTVVRLTKRASLEDTVLQSTGRNHEVKIKNVLELSDNDMRIIKKALDIYDNSSNPEHIEKLAKKASEVLNIKFKGSPVGFLKTVLKDYNVLANERED